MAPTPQTPGERPMVDRSTIGDVRLGIKADVKALENITKSLVTMRKEVDELKKSMDKLAESAGKAQSNMAGVKGSSAKPSSSGNLAGIGVGVESAGTAQSVKASSAVASSAAFSAIPTGGGAGGAASALGAVKGGSPAAMAAQVAAIVGKPIVDGILGAIDGAFDRLDARIEQGRQYAAPASRTNLLLQQASGRQESGQGSVIDAYRKPLIPYKLGMGGIDEVLQFRMAYGMSMNQTDIAQMGESIEALRVSSGMSRSTQDILNEQQSLMRPETVNRMFYMLGTSAYGVGGTETDPMAMRQQIVQRMGLTSKEQISNALKLGSVARARMADAGITDEATQTSILEYARQNVAFGEAGGTGMYDPASKEHRELLGDAEGNFALQQEETVRQQVRREEEFMSRQIDDMANTEKYQQKVVELLTSMDTALQYAYKMRQGYAGAITGGIKSIVTAPLRGLQSLLGSIGDPREIGDTSPTVGAGAGGLGTAGPNDSSRDHEIMVPAGPRGSGQRISIAELKNRSDFRKLDQRLSSKILNMMRENPNVGINSGYRSDAEQEALFYRQMQETTEDQSEVMWNGKHWKAREGYAFTAPPGRSMHGTGLAADIYEEGDGRSYAWIVANSARFGLNNWRAKGWRQDEPWHVQPAEVPRYRSEYDGGSYDSSGSGEENASASPHSPSGVAGGTGGAPSLSEVDATFGSATFLASGSMNTSQIISALSQAGTQRLLAGQGSATGPSIVGAGRPSGISPSGGSGSYTSGEPMSREEVARIAYDAGFRGQALVNMVAIAGRESSYVPDAHRTDNDPSALTGDFGLWQINYSNMSDSMMEQLGIANRSGFFDPYVNARAAYILSNGGQNLSPWGYTPGEGWTEDGEPLAGTNLAAAQEAVNNAGLGGSEAGDPRNRQLVSASVSSGLRSIEVGDPLGHVPTRSNSSVKPAGASTVNYNSSPTINVAPNISFHGMPERADLTEIARTVTKILREEVERNEMRMA